MDSKRANPKRDAHITATVNLAGTDTVSIEGELAKPEGFYQGAAWSLHRLVTWLETKKIVADDDAAQRTVNATVALIAEQARQAADKLQLKK